MTGVYGGRIFIITFILFMRYHVRGHNEGLRLTLRISATARITIPLLVSVLYPSISVLVESRNFAGEFSHLIA